jgi:von Willebrand factor type A domain
MLAAAFAFLTPWAGLLVALALVPLGVLHTTHRRANDVRRLLGLAAPASSRLRTRSLVIVVATSLLALAAMQPVVRTERSVRQRTDAEAFVVIDTSRSMAAAPSPSGSSRLARAKREALALASSFGDIPVGLATFTDRVLPDLFPTTNQATFDSAVSALGLESPPPRDVNRVATTFDALTELATQGFFPRTAQKRAIIVVTDGESRPFDPAGVGRSLTDHGIQLAVLRVGSGADRVFRPDGQPEAGYRPDPDGAALSVARLTAAARAPTGAGAVATIVRKLGTGPAVMVDSTPHARALGPLPALLALIPVFLLLGGGMLETRRLSE